MKKILIAAFAALAFSSVSYADFKPQTQEVDSHGGGTDAYGCHTNHKTGVYHCH